MGSKKCGWEKCPWQAPCSPTSHLSHYKTWGGRRKLGVKATKQSISIQFQAPKSGNAAAMVSCCLVFAWLGDVCWWACMSRHHIINRRLWVNWSEMIYWIRWAGRADISPLIMVLVALVLLIQLHLLKALRDWKEILDSGIFMSFPPPLGRGVTSRFTVVSRYPNVCPRPWASVRVHLC